MGPINPDHARLLRTLGQQLERREFRSITVEKAGDRFSVTLDPAPKRRQRDALPFRLPQRRPRTPTAGALLEFSTGELELLDAAGYSRRGTKNLMPDAYDFSQRLRVIGDFLDRRRAGDFRISWTAAGAEITYATPAGARLKETFQSDTLYDLWIHMYLRRRRRPG